MKPFKQFLLEKYESGYYWVEPYVGSRGYLFCFGEIGEVWHRNQFYVLYAKDSNPLRFHFRGYASTKLRVKHQHKSESVFRFLQGDFLDFSNVELHTAEYGSSYYIDPKEVSKLTGIPAMYISTVSFTNMVQLGKNICLPYNVKMEPMTSEEAAPYTF